MKLRQIKVATILLPAIGLAVAGYFIVFLAHDVVVTPGGFTGLLVAGSLAVFAFSTLAFRGVERLEAQVIEQNRQLSALGRGRLGRGRKRRSAGAA